MLVAIMMSIRYLGGGLGFMPSTRRTTRFMKPLGFFRPDISASRAWRVPMPPPPMPMPIIRLMNRRWGSAVTLASSQLWRVRLAVRGST